MRRKWRAVIVALAVVGAAWLVVRTDPQLGQRVLGEIGVGDAEPEGLSGSGFIEAEEVDLATELGGRIIALSVAEGDVVEAGETVVQLDTTLVEAQIAMARARLATGEAALAAVELQHDIYAERGGDIERTWFLQVAAAQAAVEEAEAQLGGAHAELNVWLGTRAYPLELQAELHGAETEAERVNLVFAVDVTIPNFGHALRPGMPAEATLELQQA